MKNKVVLITGASSGIGKATALKLLKEGFIVYGAARRIEKMKEIKEKGGKIINLDISKNDSIETAVKKIITQEGKIDILINNAGFAIFGSVEETPMNEARYQFEVNLFGLGRLTQLVIPYMRKNKSGKIINLSSIGGRIYTPLGAWYHGTKHALEGWSDCLRLELKQFGINVIIIEPGLIHTEFGEVMYEPLLEKSGNGPYKSLAKAVAKATKNAYKRKNSSPPEVIANTILKSINSKRPKTRYIAGKGAKQFLFLRKLFGDRIFDRGVMKQISKSTRK